MFGKFRISPLIVTLGLMGCMEPQDIYDEYDQGIPWRAFPFQSGIELSILDTDRTNCTIEAEQRVPQRIVSRTTPAFSTPVQTNCNQIGVQTLCNSTGGQSYGGQTVSSDANDGLRYRAYQQCMVGKSYLLIDIPACPPGVDIFEQVSALPQLSATTCYQADRSRGVAIGNG